MKIVVLDGYTENPGDLSWDGLRALGELTVYDRTRPEEAASRIQDAEIIVTNKVPVTRALLDQCTGIRYVSVLATGYNVVDLKAASERGIPVSNVPAYSTDAVAQHTFALLLELTNHAGLVGIPETLYMTKTIMNRIAEPPKSGSKITNPIIKNEITVGPNKLCQICPGTNFPSRLDKTKAK